jgi:hypothetical protein
VDASPACFVCFDEQLDNICGNCSDSDTGRKAEVRKLSSLPERRLPNIWAGDRCERIRLGVGLGPVHQFVSLPKGLLLRASVDRIFIRCTGRSPDRHRPPAAGESLHATSISPEATCRLGCEEIGQVTDVNPGRSES